MYLKSRGQRTNKNKGEAFTSGKKIHDKSNDKWAKKKTLEAEFR